MKADPNRCALIWEKDEPGDVERVTYRYFEKTLLLSALSLCFWCNLITKPLFLIDEHNIGCRWGKTSS